MRRHGKTAMGRLLWQGTALGALAIAGAAGAQDAPVTLDEVVIEGSSPSAFVAKRARGAAKTDTRLVETPQAVNVVSTREIETRGARTVAQALRYTPGLHPEPNGYDIRYDWLYVRGFNAYGTSWLNGWCCPVIRATTPPRA